MELWKDPVIYVALIGNSLKKGVLPPAMHVCSEEKTVLIGSNRYNVPDHVHTESFLPLPLDPDLSPALGLNQ